jgi:hypothetical protein
MPDTFPNLSQLAFGTTKRPRFDDEGYEKQNAKTETSVRILDETTLSFVVCMHEHIGTKHLFQRFLFENTDLLPTLKNIPNMHIWKHAKTFEFNLDLKMNDPRDKTCLVNESLEMALAKVSDDELESMTVGHFFNAPSFTLALNQGVWSTSFKLNDIGCMLSRFLLFVGDRTYLCNKTDTVFPILAYSKRESTETTVPTSFVWHVDRAIERKGALLNFIRSTSDRGISTEILRPIPGQQVPYEEQEAVRCEPFELDRTIVFNGAWYHRAPRSGGAREFMQLDFHDISSNVTATKRFLEWVGS